MYSVYVPRTTGYPYHVMFEYLTFTLRDVGLFCLYPTNDAINALAALPIKPTSWET